MELRGKLEDMEKQPNVVIAGVPVTQGELALALSMIRKAEK